MQIFTNMDGKARKHLGDKDYFTYQLLVDAVIGIGEEIKVVYRSASRNDTSYEIFDGEGHSMGGRRLEYATNRLNGPLVEDLNVLLEEYGIVLSTDDFKEITDRAVGICESRYGKGNIDGDVIVTIN